MDSDNKKTVDQIMFDMDASLNIITDRLREASESLKDDWHYRFQVFGKACEALRPHQCLCGNA